MGHSNRRAAAGTVKATLQAIEMGLPKPPANVKLRQQDIPFWNSIVRCRLPQQWVDLDLACAANLARALADIEENRALLTKQGDVIETTYGPRVNPRHALVEMLTKRAMSYVRLLQLHAVATIGQRSKLGTAKGEADALAKAMGIDDGDDTDDGLLARPTSH